MVRRFRGALCACAFVFSSFSISGAATAAESPDALWRDVPETAIPRGPGERQIVPQRYRAFELNRGRLTALLAAAPPEHAQRPAGSPLALHLPLPDGRYAAFRIVESPIMEAALAAKYPEIRTYLGQGVDDPTATVRFDVTPKGFHAQIIGEDGTYYVDPFQPGDTDHYIAYRKHDHTAGERGICEVTGEPIVSIEDAKARFGAKVSSGASLRTYRLAMAATGEYTAFHGGTVIDGLAGIVTTMNRVNGLYEREVSVRMVLVANNDRIVFTNPVTDPYTNDDGLAMLAQNQSTLDNVANIGSANYDIGHVVSTGGGGIASLRSPCNDSSKARGVTGSPAPVGDAFDVDYVAHEMGHQFGGNHTFNGSGGSCTGANRNASTAYEPGSGVTIQAYAGICGGDDLQPNSEDYFHRLSLDEILAFTTNAATGASCGTAAATGNGVPSVTAPTTVTIPGRTPFTLTAAGTDPNSDTLTYVWEQFDLGAANNEGVLDPTVATGPLFRGFAPSRDPSRTFPSLRYILNDANVVPAVDPLPGTTAPDWMTGEVLPNQSRTMSFRVTVRDNRAGGGGTNDATTAVVVANTAGPFAVTAPNTAVSLAAGAATTVTWSVANTNLVPVSTANVRIVLSKDGGYTYPIELAASTPNDGSEGVTLPVGLATTQARVRVEAVGNVYFDVSDVDFTITSGNQPPAITTPTSLTTRQGSPTASAVVASVSDAEDAAGSLSVTVSGAPAELTVTVQNVGGNVTLSATAACTLVAPTSGAKAYPVLLTVTDSAGATRSAEVVVTVGTNNVPTIGAYTTLSVIRSETRLAVPATPAADANGNFTGASISPTAVPGGGTVSIAANGTVTVTTTASTTFGTHNFRAQVQDSCGAVETRALAVAVGPPAIALSVSGSQVTTGNGLVEPNECNQLAVTLRNDGNVTATGVSALLSTATPNASITQATSAFPDIPPGESRTGATTYAVNSTSALTCFSNVAMNLNVTYAGAPGSPFSGAFNVPVGRALGTNYEFTQTSSTATLPNDGTRVAGSNGDDTANNGNPLDPVVSVTAPFAFSIYGTNVAAGATLIASTNGHLQVRTSGGANDFANAALPVLGAGNNANSRFPAAAPTLFVLWDDWRMDTQEPAAAPDAGIYTKVEGVAPNRSWIVEWRGRIRGDGAVTTNNNRVAIVLHEGSNSFDYIYLLTGAGASANGAGSTIGVQSAAAGTTFTQYALNNANIAPGTQLTAAIPPAICAQGSGTCNVPPGVTLVQSGGSTAVTEGGATDTYTLVLNSQPSSTVTIALGADAQVSTSPTPSLTFTTLDWNVPKVVSVSAVDDALVEGAHGGTITHVASGGGYGAVSIPNVVASVTDNDVAGVTIVQSGGTTAVAEGGATDSYTMRLTSQPTGTVTITSAPDAQVSVAPASLTFDATNWSTPQPVTVTAVNDAIAEGAHGGTITHAAAGGGYGAVSIVNVVASITDNDARGVTIVESGITTAVAEGGATDSYTMRLTSQPTGTVTIIVTPDAQLGVAPTSLVFDATTWSTPQPVIVTAVDDAVVEGAHAGNIAHASTGGGYDGLAIAGITASIVDNDDAGLPIVDLAASTQLLNPPVLAGKRLDYEVAVENLTVGVNVPSAQFKFALSPAFANVSWICVAEAGASCPASGSGAPDHAISLNGGTGVSYIVSADVPAASADGSLFVTLASIFDNEPHVEAFSANNESATSHAVGSVLIFSNGFEDPVAAARERLGIRD